MKDWFRDMEVLFRDMKAKDKGHVVKGHEVKEYVVKGQQNNLDTK